MRKQNISISEKSYGFLNYLVSIGETESITEGVRFALNRLAKDYKWDLVNSEEGYLKRISDLKAKFLVDTRELKDELATLKTNSLEIESARKIRENQIRRLLDARNDEQKKYGGISRDISQLIKENDTINISLGVTERTIDWRI